MKLLERILLTTDFGNGTVPALNAAVSLARGFESKLILLHVIPESLLPYMSDETDLTGIARHLREIGRQIEAAGMPGPEIVVGKGVPSEVICDEANRREANLIVIGCGVNDSIGRCRPGVTTERVIRRATTPVWVARPGAEPAPRRILCPMDTSNASSQALKNALVLCEKFNARLTVLTVQEPIPNVYSSLAVSSHAVRERFEQERSSFDRHLETVGFHDVKWAKRIRSGTPNEEIVAEALELKADLIAMGSMGKADGERILIGSVTQKVLRDLPCPVLMVKEEDVVRLRSESAVASVDDHFRQGQELLQGGRPAEAIREFDQCLLSAPTYAVAWEAKAVAYDRLGDKTNAEAARTTAKQIRNELWQRRV